MRVTLLLFMDLLSPSSHAYGGGIDSYDCHHYQKIGD
jgi:hypothetical protein